ncbi:sulfatase family protein [Propionibacteriaceae bacterium Y2011]
MTENILLVHWHDLGRAVSCYGESNVATPTLDRLAGTGLRFTNAHASSAQCSPARSSLFTGQYPHTNGMNGLVHAGHGYVGTPPLLTRSLTAHGYDTALVGLQHEAIDPADTGFAFYDTVTNRAGDVADTAVGWLRDRAASRSDPAAKADRPFLLTVGMHEPHLPWREEEFGPADGADRLTVPPNLPDTEAVRHQLALYHKAIAYADAATGRIVDALDETGLGTDTWVVFVTDHGSPLPRAKGTLYARGSGIALIVRPPAGRDVAPGLREDLFSGVDLMPTLLDLVGAPVPDEVEGVSQAAMWTGDGPGVRAEVFTERTYHNTFDPIRCVRTLEHSYLVNLADRDHYEVPKDVGLAFPGVAFPPGPRPPIELYDLARDPEERHNLIDDPAYAEVRDDLAERLARWREATADDHIPTETEAAAMKGREPQWGLKIRSDRR